MLTPCFGAKWLNSRIALLAISRRVLFLVADFATLGSKPCGMGGGGESAQPLPPSLRRGGVVLAGTASFDARRRGCYWLSG